MLLTTDELKSVASSSGMGGKCLERLLRSTTAILYDRDGKLALQPESAGAPAMPAREKKFELGLCLEHVGASKSIDRARLVAIVTDAIRQYGRLCPAVTAWLGRGDFNPKKIPSGLTVAFILHASRTAGRLRAGILRAL